jgi:hypothetical protein
MQAEYARGHPLVQPLGGMAGGGGSSKRGKASCKLLSIVSDR